MSAARHDERCIDCKSAFHGLLTNKFGSVVANADLDIPTAIESWATKHDTEVLQKIYTSLQKYRGFDTFVRKKKLSRADFFVPSLSLIFEFDETQHFTKPRDISLSYYPPSGEFGFSVKRWRALSCELNKRDNDPPFRDEQRAWYDTLKDFAPLYLGKGRTIRVYSRDLVWCSLNPKSKSDADLFDRAITWDGQ